MVVMKRKSVQSKLRQKHRFKISESSISFFLIHNFNMLNMSRPFLSRARAARAARGAPLRAAYPAAHPSGEELLVGVDGTFSVDNLLDEDGLITVAGFGSLLSVASARSTFPALHNFRQGRIRGYRRVFAHTCTVFFARGIARPETGEISSLSAEPAGPDDFLTVSLFEIDGGGDAVRAFVEREHEFRFMSVDALGMDAAPTGRRAVLCARFSDEEYRTKRCADDAEFHRRYR